MNYLINEYISKNYTSLLQISKNITKGNQLSEELLHEVLLQLYERDSEIVLNDYEDNTIRYYITSILRINWFSKTSPFYYRIRKENSNYNEINDIFYDDDLEEQQQLFEKEMLIQCLETSYSELDFWRKSMINLYLILGSVNKVAKHTGLPKSSVIKYVKDSKEKIKNNTINKIKRNGLQ